MADIVLGDEDMPCLIVPCNCHLGYGRDGNRDPGCPWCLPVEHAETFVIKGYPVTGERPSQFACQILEMIRRFQGKVRLE